MAKEQVLIVEDEIVVAEDIKSSLINFGYEVTAIADTGEEAIRLAAKTRPSVVLMDIMLEGDMDGVEAAGQIRSNFDIPVIFLSAHSDTNTLQRAKITGPFAYITKPYKKRELFTAIEITRYKHKQERALRHEITERKRMDSPSTRVRTLAFWTGGEFTENIEYALDGTPCKDVIGGELCFYAETVQTLFPKHKYLVEFGAESYIGCSLSDFQNQNQPCHLIL